MLNPSTSNFIVVDCKRFTAHFTVVAATPACPALCFPGEDTRDNVLTTGLDFPLILPSSRCQIFCSTVSIVKMSISEYFPDNAMYSPDSQWFGKWNIKRWDRGPEHHHSPPSGTEIQHSSCHLDFLSLQTILYEFLVTSLNRFWR